MSEPTTPLSDEELAHMREHIIALSVDRYATMMEAPTLGIYATDLLAEVDRLRAENAAMRPIVEAVAEWGRAPVPFTFVEQARALVAKEFHDE